MEYVWQISVREDGEVLGIVWVRIQETKFKLSAFFVHVHV